MGKVLVKRDEPHQCFARLELNNGDQVMISVAQGEVKVVKMKWAGMLPGPTLWKSENVAEIAEKFFDETTLPQRPIEAVIDKIIDCRSADGSCHEAFSGTRSRTDRNMRPLWRRQATESSRDLSELPYPKDMIKSALRHYLKKVNRADEKAVDALEVAYVSLSHFQPLTAEERDAVFLMESVHHTPEEKLEGGDLYSAVLSRWHADAAALLDELRSFISSNRAR